MDDVLPPSPRSGGLLPEGLATNAKFRRSYSAPVQPEEMNDRTTETPTAGALRPPGELGVATTVSSPRSATRTEEPTIHPRTLAQYQRVDQAVRRGHASTAVEDDGSCTPVTSFCFDGMEILVACSLENTLFVISSRTTLVLQTLEFDGVPTSLHSHPATGMVAAVDARGYVQLYTPVKADPRLISFGRYRWEKSGPAVHCYQAFYSDSRVVDEPYLVDLSQAQKFLVAHRDQLAVYCTTTADLMWITKLPAMVVAAAIAGDGRALAVILEEDPAADSAAAAGVHTFCHDEEDGSQQDIMASSSVGMVYKAGPFLVHAAPVMAVMFRGYGHCTSSNSQGNDLLLTQCKGSAQIFSQNNWNPLTEWKTPPRTRVAWVEGITAFSLGDLEPHKKRTVVSQTDPEGIHETLGKRLHFSSVARHTTTPTTTNAGAWVMEVTQHKDSINATALRLCRLAYLKRGVDDLKPTLLECASQYVPGIVRNACVAGLWSAWNRSAESLDAVTLNPPIELRLVSPSVTGRLSLLELSMFEDEEARAEMGHPVQRILALDQLDHCVTFHQNPPTKPSRKRQRSSKASTWYGTSRLVATVSGSTIFITWRQPGTCSLLPQDWQRDDVEPTRAAQLFAKNPNRLTDESHIPVPLALPSVEIPSNVCKGSVYELLWWPDDLFNGAPYLVAFLTDGSIVVLEIPPPPNSLEPPMPDIGEPPSKTMTVETNERLPEEATNSDEYQISIVPDPQYGLGIRLESHTDGLCAVAGTFKRNPVNGDLLPAEKSGLVRLGDELMAANDVVLANKPFDEIVGVVRDLGGASGPGNPLRLKFRHGSKSERTKKKTRTHRKRRTMEEMIGIASETIGKNGTIHSSDDTQRPAVSHTHGRDSIIASFTAAKPPTDPDQAEDSCNVLVPFDEDNTCIADKSALLFWTEEKSLGVSVVSISYSEEGVVDKSECKVVARPDEIDFSPEAGRIKSLEVVRAGGSHFVVATCWQNGNIFISMLTVDQSRISDPQANVVRTFHAALLPSRWSGDSTLRLHSSTLFATLQRASGTSNEITVWSALTEPGPNVNNDPCYYPSIIDIGRRTDDFEVLDFAFFKPGYLDANPLLAITSMRCISLFAKEGGSSGWKRVMEVSYGSPSWSHLPSLSSFLEVSEEPFDVFPHLIVACCASYSSTDEQSFLRSTWSPESLIANVCTNRRGIPGAISLLRTFFRWVDASGREIPVGHRFSNLVVAPLNVTENDQVEKLPPSEIRDFLLKRIKEVENRNRSNPSDRFSRDGDGVIGENSLPPVLMTLETDDLKIIYALADIAVNPPSFDKVDDLAAMFLFASALFVSLKTLSNEKDNATKPAVMPGHSLMARTTSNLRENEGSRVPPAVASSAALGALLSSDQIQLIEFLSNSRKLTWKVAREYRIPLWRRSDKKLAELAGKIGQNIFLETRDSMEAALFFIVSGKLSTFRNYVATDQSMTGKTFSQFLTKHDFSTERGRRAAEKNAFSLLRKCKYQAAAAFFLLAEPPFLKSAVETIATKMMDIDLAFLVARLMECTLRSTWQSSRSGGIIGSGGGYASTPGENSFSNGLKEPVSQWKPRLGKVGRDLLVDRMLPACNEDDMIGAICLLWLERREEACWVASGAFEMDVLGDTKFTPVKDLSSRFKESLTSPNSRRSSYSSIFKSNLYFDLASIPMLLKFLDAGKRVRLSASISVSGALSARGMEIPSVRALLEVDRTSDIWRAKESVSKIAASRDSTKPTPGAPTSSIFDSFSTCPPATIVSSDVSSSIFDSFEVPPSKAAEVQIQQSSIFDSFDVPKKTDNVPKAATTGGSMQSSIFDDFEVPPKTADVPKAATTTGSMQSSIFDDFEVPKKTTNVPKAATTTGSMQSSIFDDFDAPSKVEKSATKETEPKSSIFDDFNLPSQHQSEKQRQPSSSTSYQDNNFAQSSPSEARSDEVHVPISVTSSPAPKFWRAWADSKRLDSLARELIRLVATVVSSFYGDPSPVPLEQFYMCSSNLLSPCVAEVLQLPCDSDSVISTVERAVQELCLFGEMDATTLVQSAVELLGPSDSRRVLFSVLLHHAIARPDLADAIVRRSAHELIRWCSIFASSADELVEKRRTRSYCSSQFIRREAARLSWQLESCLWFHRSGKFALPRSTQQEAIVAVRIGLLLASWNRDFDCLESLLSSLPDCVVDEDAGLELWRSTKGTKKPRTGPLNQSASSGGWEFLVDCKRSQATDLLRSKSTGCFIIRPHSENNGVFTLSFKTNLIPAAPDDDGVADSAVKDSGNEPGDGDGDGSYSQNESSNAKKVRKEDIVQHAIIRLSDSGFRCGSFGPYTSLISLLEAVSESLPFKLRFDLPPKNRIIPEEGSQISPNAVLLRKLTLRNANSIIAHPPGVCSVSENDGESISIYSQSYKHRSFGQVLQLSVLSELRHQLVSIAAVDESADCGSTVSLGSPFRTLQPFLCWCRCFEVAMALQLAVAVEPQKPDAQLRRYEILDTSQNGTLPSDAFEITPEGKGKMKDSGNSILRGMVQPDSGLEFSTLRLIDGGDCTILVLFSKMEAIRWIMAKQIKATEEEAKQQLEEMETARVIEAIDISKLPIKLKPIDNHDDEVRFRIVDPWEVEAVKNRDGETRSASLGRSSYVGFGLGQVALTTEHYFREMGGVPLLEVWASVKGGALFTKALCALQPPWERAGGGDLQMNNGNVVEPALLSNSMRQHLYRNSLFRRLDLPQRFLCLVQVEMLDLKNLTSPGGSLSLTAYALLRLKRAGSGGPLTNKARTIESAATQPLKLNKTSGPHAPASWGSVARFRFPLPEQVQPNGQSLDEDQEALFKGPPCVLQVSVYEKKLLVDHALGTADISMDGLGAGGQLEEWVPLRTENRGITWFARIRLTLRFELMCLAPPGEEPPAGVGLERIQELSRLGGSAQEDIQQRSTSSPDLLRYLEGFVS